MQEAELRSAILEYQQSLEGIGEGLAASPDDGELLEVRWGSRTACASSLAAVLPLLPAVSCSLIIPSST